MNYGKFIKITNYKYIKDLFNKKRELLRFRKKPLFIQDTNAIQFKSYNNIDVNINLKIIN